MAELYQAFQNTVEMRWDSIYYHVGKVTFEPGVYTFSAGFSGSIQYDNGWKPSYNYDLNGSHQFPKTVTETTEWEISLQEN